ncbi:MAG TPA: PDZ domain-containing protein [Geobacteraceae bacterium]|nr:PDZ domain-containing protein [Geobacteraceae bacterium]
MQTNLRVKRRAAEKEAIGLPKMLRKLGLAVRELDANLAARLDVKGACGLYVAWTIPAGGAENAGILWGDVILEINYTLIRTLGEFEKALASHTRGTPLRFLLQRAGTLRFVEFWVNE